MDFGALDGNAVEGRDSSAIIIIKELERFLPPGSAFGQSECGPNPRLPLWISTFPDDCDYLQVQVPKGSP